MLTFQLSFIMNNITNILNLHTSLMMVQLYRSMQQYMFVFDWNMQYWIHEICGASVFN